MAENKTSKNNKIKKRKKHQLKLLQLYTVGGPIKGPICFVISEVWSLSFIKSLNFLEVFVNFPIYAVVDTSSIAVAFLSVSSRETIKAAQALLPLLLP